MTLLRRRERVEHGADDPGVDFDVFLLGRPARPDGQIDVARLQPAHRLAYARGIEKVGGDMLDARNDPFPVARYAVNAGAGVEQFLRHAAPGNAGRADDQRFDFHGLSPESVEELRRCAAARRQLMLTITFISWPLGLRSERNPFSTIASGSIRPVTIFSTGSLPLEIMRITRGHIVTS